MVSVLSLSNWLQRLRAVAFKHFIPCRLGLSLKHGKAESNARPRLSFFPHEERKSLLNVLEITRFALYKFERPAILRVP